MDKSLRKWSFEVSQFDERIYFFRQDEEFTILTIVFDDPAFVSNSMKLMNHLRQNLAANFDVKLYVQLTLFVGWSVSHSEKGIKVNQSGYIRQILKDHGMQSRMLSKRRYRKLLMYCQLMKMNIYLMNSGTRNIVQRSTASSISLLVQDHIFHFL